MESYARSIKSGSHLIYITQFHHPHHFWFKFVDTNHSDRRGLFELDTKVHEYATKRRHTVKTMAPKTGDIIAAYNIMWDKWVRGRVENVIEVENGTPRYELWAIDYGLPMSVIGIYTAPLPIELAEFNMYAVHEGCSYGIVPAEQTFDVAMLGPKLTPAEKWSPEAIAMCKSIFTSAAFILFEINEEFTDNQYVFGSLRVQLFDGSIKDINKCLMDSKLIVKIKNFDSEIDKIKFRNQFNRQHCIQDDEKDGKNGGYDSETSSEDYSRATIDWINGVGCSTGSEDVAPIQERSALVDLIEEASPVVDSIDVRSISAGNNHQTRFEKLKAQTPRFPRPLKSQSSTDGSHSPDDALIRTFEEKVTVRPHRRCLLNLAPMPSGHECETNRFLQKNRKDSDQSSARPN